MTAFAAVARELSSRGVRYVLIGASGANMHAHKAGLFFTTRDRDILLPLDPENLVLAWAACEAKGLRLMAGDEPLDEPRNLGLARRVTERRALTNADDGGALEIDLTLVMAGFDFETVWTERTHFIVEGADIPVARLKHIVASKAAAGRDKDRLFLATHEENLRQLLAPEDPDAKA